MENKNCCCHTDEHRTKKKGRDPEQLKKLQNRLNRVVGQLGGIGRMLDENRYCGDILMQIAAVQSALRALGYEIMEEHMMSCVADGVREGNDEIMAEAFELMKKIK